MLAFCAMSVQTHSIGLSKEELEKLQEIQLLDRFHPNGSEQPHWDVKQVLSHKASRTVKHILANHVIHYREFLCHIRD
jgi:hypothetical protein